MKRITCSLITIMCFAMCAIAQDKSVTSKDDGLKAIDTFSKSPLTAEGKAAADVIWKIAADTNRFTVLMPPDFLPAHKSNPKLPEPIRRALITGYLAGNIKSQINRNTKANDSYAGVQQELQTYARLKEADKTLRIPEVELLVDLERKGQLKTYINDALSKKKVAK